MRREPTAFDRAYMNCNQLAMAMGKLMVGWCSLCKKDWGLRHYRVMLKDIYEAVRESRIACPDCAKQWTSVSK